MGGVLHGKEGRRGGVGRENEEDVVEEKEVTLRRWP